MKLPNAQLAQVPDGKLLDYLLSDTHPEGQPKAKFFRSLGFTRGRSFELRRALVEHAQTHDVVEVAESRHGQKFITEVHNRRRHQKSRRTTGPRAGSLDY